MKFIFSFVAVCLALTSAASAQLIVNGEIVAEADRAKLAAAYGPVPDGQYWYDPASGFWGVIGGPSIGRIIAGLDFGAPMPATASGGGNGSYTGVFVNGREIHPEELALLTQLFGYVNPGRYWLGANLVGGYEGGPAEFDLRAAAASATGGAGYNRDTLFGGLMSDGQCSGYLHPGGSTVMTGNC
ncbi:MAG: hypothetical protein AAFR21_06065 [Pseudomonadota bacterium]